MGSLLPDCGNPVSRFHAMYAVLNADHAPFLDEIPAPFTACVTNNVSVPKDVFFSLGRFRNPVGDGPGTWTDVEFGCRVHRAGISCWRSGRALCIHRDYSIHDFATARKRAYRVARAVPALFEAHPWVRAHLPMFHDKWPIDLRQDGALTIGRKLFRRLMSSPPAVWVMERVASALTNEALLRPIYRWIFGAELYRGLRDGVSELRAASLDGGWPLWARTASKG